MKLCIPTQDDATSDSRICPHFGKATYHLVFENGEVVAQHTRDRSSAATCAPIDWILEHGVTHVACQGIGDGAFSRLQAGGITVLHAGNHRWVYEVLRAARAESLSPFDPANLCDHLHHDHAD